MQGIRGAGLGVIRDIMKKLPDPLRSMPARFLADFTDKVRYRSITSARGTNLQAVGLPPTPMYETLTLYYTMRYNWIGFKAPEYLEDLEIRHRVIWDPTENECKMLADMLAANLENRPIDYMYGSGL